MTDLFGPNPADRPTKKGLTVQLLFDCVPQKPEPAPQPTEPAVGQDAVPSASPVEESTCQKPSAPALPPKRLVLKLRRGCPEFCQLDLQEIRPVEGHILQDKMARYQCTECGRGYQLTHELGRWMHPTLEEAILPGPPCFPNGVPIPGWPKDVEAPAWVEDLIRDFADVVLRAGRQREHYPGVDCDFAVAVLWRPKDAPPQWACLQCGRRPMKVEDGDQVVDGDNFPIPDELPNPALVQSQPERPGWNPGPIPEDELKLVQALAEWGKAHNWPRLTVRRGGEVPAGEENWTLFLAYLASRQPTPIADKSRQEKLLGLAKGLLGPKPTRRKGNGKKEAANGN